MGVAGKGSEKEGSQSPEGPWSKEGGWGWGFCIQMAQHRAVNGSDLLKLLGLLWRTEGEREGVFVKEPAVWALSRCQAQCGALPPLPPWHSATSTKNSNRKLAGPFTETRQYPQRQKLGCRRGWRKSFSWNFFNGCSPLGDSHSGRRQWLSEGEAQPQEQMACLASGPGGGAAPSRA